MKKLLIFTGLIILLFAGLVSAAPEIKSAELTPSSADTTTDLTAKVNCTGTGTLTAYYEIYKDAVNVVNGSMVVTENTTTDVYTIQSSITLKDQVWNFVAKCGNETINSSALASNSVTIGNSAPVASSVAISPSTAVPTTLFTCSGSATDADGDTLTGSYKFLRGTTTLRNWQATATYQCSASNCPVASTVMCQYKANDGATDSNVVNSSIVTISAPASSITIADLALGGSNQEKSNPDEDDEMITTSRTVIVKNSGTTTLTNVEITNSNIPTKYNITITPSSIASLAPGEQTTVTVRSIVPEDFDAFDPDSSNPQDDREFSIGNLAVSATDGTDTVTDLSSVTMEVENKLEIYRLYVTVDNTQDRVDDGDNVDKIKPGDKVEVRLIADSKYSKSSNVDMNDIVFTMKIDEGDLDENEDKDIRDIDAGDDREEETIDFKIDRDADEDTYTMVITLEGKDSYDSVHGEQWEIELEVEKEKEDISIKSAILSPETLSCSRTSTLSIRLENIGKDDSDEITLVIKNDALGIFSKTRNIDLNDGDDYSKTIPISVGSTVSPGTYSIGVFTYFDDNAFDDDDVSNFKSVDLKIEKCSIPGTDDKVTPKEDDTDTKKDDTVVVIETDTDTTPSGSGSGVVARPPSNITTGLDDNVVLALIILGYIVAIGIGVILLASIFRKR